MNENNVTMSTEAVNPVEKIKAINPVITVNTKTDKPCYSIQYYDLADQTWHIGYSSFNLDYVREWLADCFEPFEADLLPVKYGHWNDIGNDVVCSECGCSAYDGYTSNYCPDCGATMLLKVMKKIDSIISGD